MIYLGFMNVVNRAERTDMIVALIEQRQTIQRSSADTSSPLSMLDARLIKEHLNVIKKNL